VESTKTGIRYLIRAEEKRAQRQASQENRGRDQPFPLRKRKGQGKCALGGKKKAEGNFATVRSEDRLWGGGGWSKPVGVPEGKGHLGLMSGKNKGPPQ